MLITAHPVYQKITWRLIPVLFTCYVLAYLDRVNVGFAKLSMKEEPWFSDAVFATGSGIFFIGYFLFEVPGNLILHRIGARIWITRIMISWGILSCLCALSSSPALFYSLRFLLGVAEAGFFPGIILYLTYWYPGNYRARIVALFMTAVAFAGIIGSPLSGWILKQTEAWTSGKAWQWLFLIEGIPSIVVGIFIPWLLSNNPQQATWLTTPEKRELLKELEADERIKEQSFGHAKSWKEALRNGRVWLGCLIYLCITVCLYGLSFWLPQIIENTITKDKFQIGLVSAIPWITAAGGMIYFGLHSDKTGERKLHISFAALLATIGFVASSFTTANPYAVVVTLSMAATGVMCLISSFWSLPTAILSGSAAAAGIAWINSVGNLGGYISPELFRWLNQHFDFTIALRAIGGFSALAGILVYGNWKMAKPRSGAKGTT